MIQLKFYANRQGFYHNKLFTFNIKQKQEIGNILIPFINNNNTFNIFYIHDSITNYTYSPSFNEIKQLVTTSALLKGIQLVKPLVSVLLLFVIS